MKGKILISVILLVIIYIVMAESVFIAREKSFNKKDISGIILNIYSSRDGIKLSVSNDSKSYRFFPKQCNQSVKDFVQIAKVGDSIYKPAYSDTIKLIKNGQVYLYTFN